MSRLLFEARAAVLACEAQQALIEKEIELEKLKQQRKPWVGLSNDEIYDMYNEPRSDAEMVEFARAIEAKLREKNA